MDGDLGETHVELGAKIMHALFDRPQHMTIPEDAVAVRQRVENDGWRLKETRHNVCLYMKSTRYWYDFCLYHSRFYARRHLKPFSRLCVADKYAFVCTPRWLYLLQARLSGEIHEYITKTNAGKYTGQVQPAPDYRGWHANLKTFLVQWVAENRDRDQL